MRSRVRVNILGQYTPDFLVRDTDGPLARRPLPAEVARVRDAALEMGFETV
jgi:uncharacterized Fe-S radical SAM superfamily protein PflX